MWTSLRLNLFHFFTAFWQNFVVISFLPARRLINGIKCCSISDELWAFAMVFNELTALSRTTVSSHVARDSSGVRRTCVWLLPPTYSTNSPSFSASAKRTFTTINKQYFTASTNLVFIVYGIGQEWDELVSGTFWTKGQGNCVEIFQRVESVLNVWTRKKLASVNWMPITSRVHTWL